MALSCFDTEILLLQIEELFERFRNLPLNSRAIILEKIRIKLLEEFKDFVIQENDGAQETILEIPSSHSAEVTQKTRTFNDRLPNSADNYAPNMPEEPKDDDVYLSLRSPLAEFAPEDAKRKGARLRERQPRKPSKSKKLVLMCNYCGKQFHRTSLFDRHLDRHKNERVFKCSTCSNQFNTKDDLYKHLRSHLGVRNFACNICSKKLVNSTTLRNHIRVMHQKEEKYLCNKCDYYAYSKHTLKEHIRVKHEKGFKKYACLVCANVYNSSGLLKIHLRSHTGEKPYKCRECEAAFVSSGILTNHTQSVHGERKHVCEVCEKSFKTVHKLKRHSYIHTRVKPFPCPFCTNYASNTQGNLTKHVKTVHQMNEFSYLRYKRMMQGEILEVSDEWFKNAESFTNAYLKNVSTDENTISVAKLKEKHLETKKKPTEKRTVESNVVASNMEDTEDGNFLSV